MLRLKLIHGDFPNDDIFNKLQWLTNAINSCMFQMEKIHRKVITMRSENYRSFNKE